MTQEFRTTHLIQAALQQRGAPIGFIQDFLAKLEARATSSEEFNQWNKVLDQDGIKTLSLMLTPRGAELCDMVLDTLFAQLTERYSITPEELQTMSKFN